MYAISQLLDKINDQIATMSFARAPQALYAPVTYMLSLGGKRIRPVMVLLAYNLYRDDIETIYDSALGIEIYHNYTLMHDDVMDRADVRRGKPTVHKLWNDDVAILSGDAMLVLAYRYISSCAPEYLKKVLDLFNETSLEICEGQQLDMEFELRNDVQENEYIEMIRMKTGVLLAACLKMGAMLGGAPDSDLEHLYNFGMQIGIAFQLQDDLLDVYGNPRVFGKKIGGDILCNKKTYMLIKALERADAAQKEELTHWLEVVDCEQEEKINAVKALYDKLGIRALCNEKIRSYYAVAMGSLEKVGVPNEKKAELKTLAETLMCREI